MLYLSGTQITDLTPIAGMTGITTLDLRNTQITDLTPIAGMTGITRLGLSGTQITDLAPIAGMTGITTLDLRNTQITDLAPIAGMDSVVDLHLADAALVDLRPILTMTGLGSDDQGPAITFQDSAATRVDHRLKEISDIDDWNDRLKELRNYLADWVPPEPEDDTGEPLAVELTGGRLEVAESVPSEAERDERLKQVLHQRLIPEAEELAQLAGNRFDRTSRLARSLHKHLDKPFEDVDLLNVHLDIEALRALHDRGAERDMGEPFSDEVKDALAQVLSTGPGLTLDNPDVEVLLGRINRFRDDPQPINARHAHDQLSAATTAEVNAIGDRLRSIEDRMINEPLPPEAKDAVQDKLHKSLLLRIGRLALAGGSMIGGAVFMGIVGTPIANYVVTNLLPLLEVAALYGSFLQTWFANALSSVPDLRQAMVAARGIVGRRRNDETSQDAADD